MKQRMSYWGYCLLIAVVYGLTYAAIRGISLGTASAFNWIPVAALRLSCLLLMPIRYWPALVVGEAIPLGYANYLCLDQQGAAWVWVNSIPRVLEAMPFVWLLRKRYPDIRESIINRTAHLLACIAMVSIASALFGWLSYGLMKQLPPDEHRLSFGEFSGQIFLGGYLSMISFTPLALWIVPVIKHAMADKMRARDKGMGFVKSLRWLGPSVLLAIDGLMVLVSRHGGEMGRQWAVLGILATLIPVAASYGWAGTAIVGAAANVAVVSIMPAYNDAMTLVAQGFLGLFMTMLLLFAARSSMAFQYAQGERKAIEQARRSYMMTERMRVNSVCHLSDALDNTRMETTRLMHSARAHMPTKMLAEHFHRLESLHQECECILMGMSPYDWWDFGDREGLIISALHAEGIGCDVLAMPRNARLLQLSTDMCITIHRLGCEALLHALDRAPSNRISLAFAVKKQRDGYHIEMIVECTGLPMILGEEAYERLMVRIGAFGLSERGLRERAQLYDGDVQCTQVSKYEARVVVRLIDKPRHMVA